jgi:CheY-like chemotaxis protein
MEKIKKVLLLDDSKAVNLRNVNLLKELNFCDDIVSLTDPREAIEYLSVGLENGNLPNVIFLDLSMPEMDGFNFLDQYVQITKNANSNFKPHIVIVSDYLDFKNFDKSKEYKSYGVIDHIRKPIDKEDIANLLEEHFDEY